MHMIFFSIEFAGQYTFHVGRGFETESNKYDKI
jgi:hypothetical protein